MVFLLARAVAYATAFISLLLIVVPARILAATGIAGPTSLGGWQIAGGLLGLAGAALALWCILTFVVVGRGTPAPFDPPRRLVVRGPYRYARNPMYIGAGIAVSGAALFYQSAALLGYAGVFLLLAHVLVVAYEEPTLRRTFGPEYADYCRQVGRWWPAP